jgi:hypothetical protein
MAPADFEFLINLIGPKTVKKGTRYRAAVSVAGGQPVVALRFFATGDSYTSLQHLFKISKQAIGQIVPEAHSFI